MQRSTREVRIVKTDDVRHVVYGEVYAPMTMDTHGEFMFAEDVAAMAHKFMSLDASQVIDTNHDNVPNGSVPIESFIAREGDPDFTPGAWVLGVQLSDAAWGRVKSGELNAFSFEAMVRPVAVEAEVESVRDRIGLTETDRDHDHAYFVVTDALGRVVAGWTDSVKGHRHEIKIGSRTESAGRAPHSHRIFV